MKIHIMGASGAGTTTLGNALAEKLSCPYFDTDTYFWEASEPPFTIKRDPEIRNRLLLEDLAGYSNWIIGGSLVSWGDYWKIAFDLVVFLYVPKTIRMRRLEQRELERYGSIIFDDVERNEQYQAFMNWAAAYDDPDNERRSLTVHERWLEDATCPVMQIRGDTTVDERISKILSHLS